MQKKVSSKKIKLIIISLSRIGDLILTLPIMQNIKKELPNSEISILTYYDCQKVLSGFNYYDQIICINRKRNIIEQILLLFKIYKKFDYSFSFQTGDKPTLYSILSGKLSHGLLSVNANAWKRNLLTKFLYYDNNKHIVNNSWSLVSNFLGVRNFKNNVHEFNIASKFEEFSLPKNFVVVHPCAKFSYKELRSEQWIELLNTLINKGENIVLISGRSKKEIELANIIHRRFPNKVKNYAGAFDIEQIPVILKKAKLFIGLDSSISHLSALLGLKTVVIFGPTNPKNWIPVPINYQINNSLDFTPLDQIENPSNFSNVFLIRNLNFECVPCENEGCEKNINSVSNCLHQLDLKFFSDKIYKFLIS